MKRKVILLCCAALILLATPIVAYVWHFRNSDLSSDPQAWGVLGDYLGGLLNPVIAFANLVVFGRLTYLVALQSSKENKSLFLLERRMLAYDEIAKFVKPINSFAQRMENTMAMMNVYEKLPNEQAAEHMIKLYIELRSFSYEFTDFFYTLFEFNPRYGHLFKYDFNAPAYRDLLAEAKRVGAVMSKLLHDHRAIMALPDEEKNLNKLAELFFLVFVDLRAEVETKLD